MRAKFLIMIAVTLVASVATVSTAGAAKPPNAEAEVQVSRPLKKVSATEVLLFGKKHGFEKGSDVAALEAAAGVEEPTTTRFLQRAAALSCWSISHTRGASWWFGWVRLNLDTYWCGDGGTIRQRSSYAWNQVAGVCGGSGASQGNVGGGIGHSYVQVRASGSYACFAWPATQNFTLWFTIYYSGHGTSYPTSWGGP